MFNISSKIFVKIDDYWFDVTNYNNHPGGSKILKKYHMKDATDAFNAAKHVDGLLYLEDYEVKDLQLVKYLNENEIIDSK